MNDKEEKIIIAARTVFMKYGYKRVTMNDIAIAANISRPSVYLVFPGKEEIFRAVMNHIALSNLENIRKGLQNFSSCKEKLMYAFELWTIKPFEFILKSPEAKELTDYVHEFAKEVYEHSGRLFEAELIHILKPQIKKAKLNIFSPEKVAYILRHAARGLKEAAKNPPELRRTLTEFIDLILSNVPKEKRTQSYV